MKSFTPYMFLVDVYKREKLHDEAGQVIDDFIYDRTISVNYMPSRGEERLVGRIQNPKSYRMWTDDDTLSVSERLKNLRTKTGDVIEPGSMNIIYVKPFPRLGKVHHVEVSAQVVLE